MCFGITQVESNADSAPMGYPARICLGMFLLTLSCVQARTSPPTLNSGDIAINWEGLYLTELLLNSRLTSHTAHSIAN